MLTASVVVRCRDKADTIGQTLTSLREQSCDVEIVVVDSGSSDGTVDMVRPRADVLLQIRPEEFSYGGALNLGTQASSGDVVFGLSAHCAPTSRTWVADSLNHYADARVAGTNGATAGPDGRPLSRPYRPTQDELLLNSSWGFSNHAASWRASVVHDLPFRADMQACEDKEWSWRVRRAGWELVFDPALIVSSDHRRKAGLQAAYARNYKEAMALARLGLPVHETASAALHQWWSSYLHESRRPALVKRVSPHWVVNNVATWRGTQAGLRRPVR